jgi:eukaryotic-like serine/threonine-protein kinase
MHGERAHPASQPFDTAHLRRRHLARMASHLPERLRALLDAPEPERRIGAFRLKKQLGRGGFAPVWLADEVAGATTLRQAAIKLFAIDARLGEAARQDIIAEAERLCRVEHPNIVRFYALPVDDERGVMGLAMEYVGGQSLAERLWEVERLPVREAVDVGIAVASALVAVHAAGLVHRDVGPANVIENRALRGSPAAYKLIDFGIAVAGARQPPPSNPGTTTPAPPDPAAASGGGSPGAVPPAPSPSVPEAWIGKRGYVDPVCWRELTPATKDADLYALGALLFVCLSGKIPAAAAGALDEAVLSGKARPPRLSELRSDLPPRLVELVADLLDPDRERRPGAAEIVAIELERLRSGFSGRARALPSEDDGPFRGLSRFEREHRDVFFGRRVEVAVAVEVLRTRGLLALVGPSGTGKSSLARAGILPAVEDGSLGGPRQWDMVVLSPGPDPRQVLTTALFHMGLDPSLGAAEAAARIEAWLADNQRGLVLLVDQLEELATLEEAGDQLSSSRAFTMDLLARLGERARPALRVIVTARRDLLDPILAHRALGHVLMRGSVLVSPLAGADWGQVLDAALESYGYSLEDAALREELRGSIARSADAMPLVEFALSELWRTRDRQKKQITWAGWKQLGGIAGALEQHAEATLYPAGRAALDDAAPKRVLLALTTPSGARAARPLSALTDDGRDAAAEAAVRLLEEARLVVREGDGITLSHEVLLSHWRRLAAWVAEEKEDRLLLEDLERVAGLWSERRDDELLFRRRRVLLVNDVLRRRRASLEGATKRFYQASRLAAARARIALVAGLSTLAAVAALGTGIYVDLEARRVQEAQRAQGAELRRQLEVVARQKAELERDRAAEKWMMAQAEAQAEKAAAVSAYEQLKKALAEQRPEESDPPKGVKPIDPGTLMRDLDDYILERLRQNEAVPDALADVIPEALVKSQAGAEAPPPPSVQPFELPAAPAAPAAPTRTMVLGAAYAALQTAKENSGAACRRNDGPRGAGKVALVVEPSGKVSSVAMDARFLGTDVGRCVDAAFREVRVPPFDGKPITVLWSFAVR